MTDQASEQAQQDSQAPPAETPESSPAERVMGLLACLAAGGLLLIGLDMVTGGQVLPALARIFGGQDASGE